MNILVVNDDGYTAPGIAALVRELRKEHDVFVCAPEGKSECGRARVDFEKTAACGKGYGI